MRSKPVPAARLLLPLCLCLLAGCAADAGRREARRDLDRGHRELRVYGVMWPQDHEYALLLRESADTRFNRIAGCAIIAEARERADGYNEVMETDIERVHGKGYLDRLMEQARARHSQRQAAANRIRHIE